MTLHQPLTPGPIEWIDNDSALAEAVDRLRGSQRVALDTEAASFHRYVDRVYLVQMSGDLDSVLIDPLAISDLTPIGSLLADPAIEVVFHDADYDLRILDRDFGFHAVRVFDTRIAAQLANEPMVGLGALLEKYFAVKLNKKLQRADWSQRPLTEEMIAYAAADTHYLPRLRDLLEERLRGLGRFAWAEEEFRRLESIRWEGRNSNEEPYLRIKGAKALKRRQLAILRALVKWRDSEAAHLDRAPFRVLSNTALIDIARRAPGDADTLRAIGGVGASTIRRHGATILDAVRAGLAVSESELPSLQRKPRPAYNSAYDQRLERLKQLRNARAQAIGMEPGLLCPNGTLQAIARAEPDGSHALAEISELRQWQREVVGDRALLEAVRGNGDG